MSTLQRMKRMNPFRSLMSSETYLGKTPLARPYLATIDHSSKGRTNPGENQKQLISVDSL